MSFRERRERDEQRARERALVGMRDMVIAGQAGFLRTLGSAAIADAVDEALARMKPDERLGDPDEVGGLWSHRARCRLINQQQSAEMLHREPVALDEHAQALTVSASGEHGELTDQARQCWRLEEIVNSVHGEQQQWVDAYAERVLDGSLDLGAQPRGLPEQLGWSAWKTKRTARQARATMAAFIQERASGSVCTERQALLDSFIATDSVRGDADSPVLDQDRYLAMLLHVGGCHECSLAWRERRRTVTRPVPGVLALPLDVLGWAARKAHELAGSVDVATLSVRQRLGLGGGASAAAAGGGAATVGTKAAAVCVAAVCAAGAGGEIAGVVAPIVSKQTQHEPRKQRARHDARPARQVVRPASSRVVAAAPVSPARPPAPATSVAETAAAPEERFTPGDLPPASSTSPGGSSASSAGGGSSAPGDLPSASSTSADRSSGSSAGGGLGAPAPPPPPPPPASGGDGAHCVLGELGC